MTNRFEMAKAIGTSVEFTDTKIIVNCPGGKTTRYSKDYYDYNFDLYNLNKTLQIVFLESRQPVATYYSMNSKKKDLKTSTI